MSKESVYRVASLQYEVGVIKDWASFETKIAALVKEAAQNGAVFLIFPEYATMEVISIFPESLPPVEQLRRVSSLLPQFSDLFRSLAESYQVFIIAPTFPYTSDSSTFLNRAYIFSPEGKSDFQDKLVMTRFEKERLGVTAGKEIKVFNTDIGRVAVNVCYDSEFPGIARAQALSGAKIIAVPSCTDSVAGYYRVRTGCRARALENQCYVIQSVTVGGSLITDILDVNIGSSGIYAPPDINFPDDGIVAGGRLNDAGWIYGDLDIDLVDRVRNEGQVFNYRDLSDIGAVEGLSVSSVNL